MLRIVLTRKPDGGTVLACSREDGTSTWQHTRQAFFPFHDLTHYAVETTLGLRHGFYGLLADGWNITDFGKRPFPEAVREEALRVEALVSLFDQERGTGIVHEAPAFNEALASMMAGMGLPPPSPLTDDTLAAIRARIRELAGRWQRTAPGASLTLPFPADNA